MVAAQTLLVMEQGRRNPARLEAGPNKRQARARRSERALIKPTNYFACSDSMYFVRLATRCWTSVSWP